jgi:hypothetical protein
MVKLESVAREAPTIATHGEAALEEMAIDVTANAVREPRHSTAAQVHMMQHRSAARDRDLGSVTQKHMRKAKEIVAAALRDAELVLAAEAEQVAEEGRREH